MNFLNPVPYPQVIRWENQTIEKDVDCYYRDIVMIEKIKLQIEFTSNKKIIYSNKGTILKIEEIHGKNNPIILNNMEQIKSLSWFGEINQKGFKDGKWIALWDKKAILNVGGYYKNGLKQGLWKDLFKNYQSKSEIYETGQYLNDCRIGKWNFFYDCEEIGCGLYNNIGRKIGKWKELGERFYDDAQITYYGNYNLNGMKVGIWDTIYCKDIEQEYKQMGIFIYSGGGSYDQEGNQKKIGKWIELDEKFSILKQVLYIGRYMNGMKVGKWDIMYCKYGQEEYKQINIQIQNKYSGGGSYDQEGNQNKIGKWVDLLDGFLGWSQVTYNGEYNMNGMKVGKWDNMYIGKIINNLLVEVDLMIKEEIKKRLEGGQNWMKGLMVVRK